MDETKVSIDFSDGNGFVEIVMGEKVGVKYAGSGEKAIITKISDSKDEYLIYSKILVTEYDNTKPDIIFNLSSDQVVNPNGRVQTLSGGQAWLYNGCDRIFDKPVIIVEGFDPTNENDIDIRQLFNIAQNDIDRGKAYLNSPAARQMLLRNKGANPHSDFTAFQNEFNQMGFPSQNNIRNISIINASELGITQSPIGNFNPGDLLFNATSLHGFANVVIKSIHPTNPYCK
ncbi:hypothetical protein [Algoriphagus boritolerans]|uniref:Uncharacterized protein n=1 Tax=Algoriphagus boritolerans DSM 17298 = JCM 18970 TaxID=1120964 RepID=A0A1H5YK99_9BACT|nr:hypothetical protein [Algoriphagus boritolerans]SEG24150.1 hypothetical protein SAMN03080598_03050 [Algoriphagus boritolerans DSM 17298 = JCM 18970]